jgi:hypothetical protein
MAAVIGWRRPVADPLTDDRFPPAAQWMSRPGECEAI